MCMESAFRAHGLRMKQLRQTKLSSRRSSSYEVLEIAFRLFVASARELMFTAICGWATTLGERIARESAGFVDRGCEVQSYTDSHSCQERRLQSS